MAIRIIDQYPGQVGAPDVNYPEGVPRNVTSPGGGDGTPWEEALLKDMQGLMQGLLAQVPAGPIVPSGVPDTVLISQYIDAMKLITQGLDVLTFANAENDTSLRLAPDGLGNTQWLLNVADQLATAILDTSFVLKPDGLGGVFFGSVPVPTGIGGFKSTQTFEAGGTWTRPAGITLIRIITLGGGGGASGSGNAGGTLEAGGAGAYSEFLLDVTIIPSIAVTVGAGGNGGVGAAGTNTPGSNGGVSTFGSHTSCDGGFGGLNGATNGGRGGAIPSLGDVKSGGGDSGGAGGASFFGSGGQSPGTNGDGFDAKAYGAGGGTPNASGTPQTGGDGRAGVIIVEEYS